MKHRSESVVSFISNLMPSYHGRRIGELWCAESLDDGTLIFPIAEEFDTTSDAFLRVCWQGHSERESEVLADSLATVAVVRHIELHYCGQPIERAARELQFLSQHYQFKTGGSLYLPYDKVPAGLANAVASAVGRLGDAAVIELLKKAVGFP